jgi:hypothetical protein
METHANSTASRPGTVFLFDVDNTLLDNDRVSADLKRHLKQSVGEICEQRYWDIFEEIRSNSATLITSGRSALSSRAAARAKAAPGFLFHDQLLCQPPVSGIAML